MTPNFESICGRVQLDIGVLNHHFIKYRYRPHFGTQSPKGCQGAKEKVVASEISTSGQSITCYEELKIGGLAQG